jgi:hypothetical protein
LFCGEDDVFSWASVGGGQGFGVFPELRITHLILAGRLNQRYFLRLIHDQAFSHGVLHYLLAGIQQRRIDLPRYLRLLLKDRYVFLHGIKHSQFAMRWHWARLQGEDCAARFISERRMRPIGSVASMS